jgi:Na+/H+-dicarboxylate symporter
MKLWHKVLIGLILGTLLGILAKEDAQHVKLIETYIKPIGDIFIKLILMIVAPLVYFSLVQGITSVSDPSSLGRIGMKASIAFLTTTAFAIVIGMTTAVLMKPGVGTAINFKDLATPNLANTTFSFANIIVDAVPGNLFKAFAESKMLQVVFFAIFTGITLNSLSGEDRKLIEYFHFMSKLFFKMMSIIIKFSPYGAFALTCWVITEQGMEVMHSLMKLVLAVVVAMIVQYLIFGVLIKVFAKISPLPFYKKSLEYQALALSTSSSKATLATTMKVCRHRLGISNASTSFVLPLGASINMDGMAIYLGMCAIFFAQVSGVELSTNNYVIIALTATLGSIGGAGIPGGSIVMLPMILSAVNLPLEGVALIAGIDRILDMLRTIINITGDVAITLIIDKTEGTLDETLYLKDDSELNYD